MRDPKDTARLEAAHWIDRIDDTTDIDSMLSSFVDWLEAVPDNRAAYWDMREAHDDLQLLRDDPNDG